MSFLFANYWKSWRWSSSRSLVVLHVDLESTHDPASALCGACMQFCIYLEEAVNEKARTWLRDWLGVKTIDLSDLYEALMDSDGHLVNVGELEARVKALQDAYAEDPRRKEIEKEKAEAPTVMGGFRPRSARIRAWEQDRKAKPKSE